MSTAAQPSDTGDGSPADTPDPVPYDRFKEVNEAKKAALEAKAEAEARAQAAESKWQEIQETLNTRLPPVTDEKKPDKDEWVDPAEETAKKALEAAQAAANDLEELRDLQRRRDGASAIQAAVNAHEFEDPDDILERLSERFFLAQHMGKTFDAAAEAKAFADKEKERAEKRKAERQRRTNEEATASAMTGGASPPMAPSGARLGERPPWGTPERKQWDADMEAAILKQHGIGG